LRTKLKKIVLPVIPLVMIGLTILISSCCEDCIINPQTQPYQGYLYVADTENGWVYQIDTETDSLVDSVNYVSGQQYYAGNLDVSPDGKYLAVGYGINYPEIGQVTVIYDAQTLNVIMELQYSYKPAFILEQNLMLGFMHDSVHIYSIPDFTKIHADTITSDLFPVVDESKNIAYLYGTLTPDRLDSTYIAAYDYIQRKVVDTWFIRDSQDSLVLIFQTDIHLSDARLYCTGGSNNDGLNLICYDLERRETIYATPTSSQTGSLRISPDGQEIYISDPGWFGQTSIPGIIFVHDASSGNYIDGISLYGSGEYPAIPLYATPIIFTPTGEKAYVGSGRLEKGSGTISVIDTQERKVIKHIWPDKGHYFLYMCIGPKQ